VKNVTNLNAVLLGNLVHGISYIQTQYWKETKSKIDLVANIDVINGDLSITYKKFVRYDYIDLDTVVFYSDLFKIAWKLDGMALVL
jgi:hypothetical protein